MASVALIKQLIKQQAREGKDLFDLQSLIIDGHLWKSGQEYKHKERQSPWGGFFTGLLLYNLRPLPTGITLTD